ncbi:LysR family transcriptional regulator [Providencia stuartii]|nr:LysR family transcriptional regulator [Providencia stuartii]MDT7052267.1 LysR family transcriptional regulator [Providencia stuartii]
MLYLNIDAIKVFLTIAESKSFTVAARELCTTQGALSIKR